MKPEYFAPREDIILQNEAPTEFYIVVSGALVLFDINENTPNLFAEFSSFSCHFKCVLR